MPGGRSEVIGTANALDRVRAAEKGLLEGSLRPLSDLQRCNRTASWC